MKAVLLYLILVGAPVAGIYGIVRLGQDLKPPISVAGAWNVELTPRTADTAPCRGLIVSSKSLILKVTQTGPHLALTLNDQNATRLAGVVNLERLTARSLEQIEAMPVAPGMTSPIQLQANIDRQPGLDRLSGTFTFANCPAGTELSFTAMRQQRGAGAGH
jgi:hypothetical protein